MKFNGQGENVEYGWDEEDSQGGGGNIGPLSDQGDGIGDRTAGGRDGSADDTSGPAGTGYSPRENFGDRAPSGDITASPRKPMEPTPMAGMQSESYGGPRDEQSGMSQPSAPAGGVSPFKPMASGPGGVPAGGPIGQPGAGRSSLFGGVGGLKGGGLGVPSIGFDPHQGGNDTTSIDQLIAALSKQKRGLF